MLSQAILAPLRGDLCKILHPNFYEKALFVKADLAASSRPSAAAGPFARYASIRTLVELTFFWWLGA
jgi:hypothetical protein